MNGLIPDEEIRNKGTGEDRTEKQIDEFLNQLCEGAHPGRIGVDERRGRKAGMMLAEKFTSNYKDRVRRYQPSQWRISRKGKRFTRNEEVIISRLRKEGVEAEHIARLLCRGAEQIDGGLVAKEAPAVGKMKQVAPTMDLIWAHRYIYFVYKKPVISDETYDNLVKEEIEYGGGGAKFVEVKRHRGWPEHIISLAIYLVQKAKES